MSKTRVSALAKELGVGSRELITLLAEMGEYVKSASSTIEGPVARRVRTRLADTEVDSTPTLDNRALSTDHPSVPTVTGADSAIVHQVLDLARWADAAGVMRACREAIDKGRPLTLDLSGFQRAFPSSVVPVAATVQHFRQLGLRINVAHEPWRVRRMNVMQPLEVIPENLSAPVLGTVWVYYDAEQANALERRIVGHLERTVPMVQGVQQSLYLCLVEVIDNVLQHSGDSPGFFMCDLMTGDTRLAMAISDTGMGALNSLRRAGQHSPATDFDALTMAIQAGVTGTPEGPRGNGLYTLQRTVECNGGSLELRSGSGLVRIRGREMEGKDFRRGKPPLGPQNRGFFVDWQLDLSTPITLDDVYNEIMPQPPANLRLEALEDENDLHVIRIRDYEEGLGTRTAAEHLRTYLVNMLNLGAPRLVLDFAGVAVVGASFADEVVGKLVEQFGFVAFSQLFSMRNVESGIQLQLNRAIALRVGAQHQAAVVRPARQPRGTRRR